MSEQVAIAKAIAYMAHREQADKAGAPYFEHPAAVAALIEAEESFGENYVAVAWLHDVLEDARPYMCASGLETAGVDYEIADAVQLLSRNWQPKQDYYQRIARNELALVVKFADIAHNSNPERLAQLAPEVAGRLLNKYRRAVLELLAACPMWVMDNAFGDGHDMFGVMGNLGMRNHDLHDLDNAPDARDEHDPTL